MSSSPAAILSWTILVARIEAAGVADHAGQAGLLLLGQHRLGIGQAVGTAGSRPGRACPRPCTGSPARRASGSACTGSPRRRPGCSSASASSVRGVARCRICRRPPASARAVRPIDRDDLDAVDVASGRRGAFRRRRRRRRVRSSCQSPKDQAVTASVEARVSSCSPLSGRSTMWPIAVLLHGHVIVAVQRARCACPARRA